MPTLSQTEVSNIVAPFLEVLNLQNKRLLLIIPDLTRSAPVGWLFKTIWDCVGETVEKLDVLVALGTHPPLSESQINARLELSQSEREGKFARVEVFNHEWDNPQMLAHLGTIPAREIGALSGGLFEMDVAVTINKRVFDYDQILILGPVFPHEVVGFSGGNKYLFPGIGGPELLNFFHWLGAVITNPGIIGHKTTPVRAVVDRADQMVSITRAELFMVVETKGGELVGLFAGTQESAWDEASNLSNQIHILKKPRPFHTVLSCAPAMYDDLWVGGKSMYKLEPVVADGGELIIYAPHISEISVTHGATIERLGYHCRDYFLKQWDKFRDEPWGLLAHSTHVRGVGTWENGIENCRIRVTLATQIPRETCEKINLGWRDWRAIDFQDFQNREEEGILWVEKAGEMLYRLD